MDEDSKFKRAIETQKLVEKFGSMVQGDSITDEEINGLFDDPDFMEEKRHIVESAREIARHEYGINIERIEKTGYRILTDEETGLYPWIAKIRNTVQRHTRFATYIKDYDSLSQPAKYKHHTTLTMLRLTNATTNKTAEKKIGEYVQKSEIALDLQQTMKLFLEQKSDNPNKVG